ncbi:hypothetical protein G6F55_012092 [Rhizopus delemar]|nr:hypothetical protein G6F55_012092 [Rhizopus delemar]
MSQNPDCTNVVQPQLSIVESQLAEIQQYHVDNLALRTDPIDNTAMDNFLDSLPEDLHLSEIDRQLITSPITYDELLEEVSRCPQRSSPGVDGLPYELLNLLFRHPACREIVLAVYNNALTVGIFPPSWQETCVSLLPKKGDLSDLKNWRPISLINADVKAFTRILNARIINIAKSLITPFQTGFVHGRFIADNGLLMKLVMDHARNSHSQSIGLMLDQEKACDKIHPEYLHKVLLRFGFSPIVVHSLSNMFFGTQLRLNVNGFLSPSVPQLRGLQQGDPISPVLFNLAFEPLLRRIIRDLAFCGFALPRSSLSHPLDLNLQPIKLLAYADDMVCLLHDPNDLNVLHSHLEVYSRASNAQINFHKTLAVSLSGACISSSATWRSSLITHRITHWHDRSSTLPATYLGYPLCSSISQRNEHLSQLLGQIKTAGQLHSQRSLSVRGRVTVLNTLVLSKLWHVLCLIYVPSSFISKLKGIMFSFLTFRMFPKISLSTMCLPRSSGGLGVLDPGIQQHALQLRWLIPLLSGAPIGPPATFWTSPMICNSLVLPRLADCLLHHLQSDTTSSVFTWPLADYRLSFVFRDLRPPSVRSSSTASVRRLPR